MILNNGFIAFHIITCLISNHLSHYILSFLFSSLALPKLFNICQKTWTKISARKSGFWCPATQPRFTATSTWPTPISGSSNVRLNFPKTRNWTKTKSSIKILSSFWNKISNIFLRRTSSRSTRWVKFWKIFWPQNILKSVTSSFIHIFRRGG